LTAIVYLGPSAPLSAARAVFDADFRPPVRHGDVWRALEEGPRAIGIIDGVFEQVPAVWHKEILAALDAGVHVFGASSMGALRAAELHPFGMRGVGRIFEAFRDGAWVDDDEVALQHGPAETGYVGLSEPMANVRFTIAAAREAGAISNHEADALLTAAKSIYYPRRSWAAIERMATTDAGMDLAGFPDWRAANRVDRKRLDALEMLAAMRDFLAADPPPFAPDFAFERTDLAEHARRIALGA